MILTIRPSPLWREPLGLNQISGRRLYQVPGMSLLELHWRQVTESRVHSACFVDLCSRGTRQILIVLSSAASAERQIYFNDRVTGRLAERSGWVRTNLSRRV